MGWLESWRRKRATQDRECDCHNWPGKCNGTGACREGR